MWYGLAGTPLRNQIFNLLCAHGINIFMLFANSSERDQRHSHVTNHCLLSVIFLPFSYWPDRFMSKISWWPVPCNHTVLPLTIRRRHRNWRSSPKTDPSWDSASKPSPTCFWISIKILKKIFSSSGLGNMVWISNRDWNPALYFHMQEISVICQVSHPMCTENLSPGKE